ncbi:MAG TPA: hypothetical protein VKI62_07870 [Bacteroidota bacterium]|nr:hypothetical protein [Bacteroidota bacterium]
MDQARQRGYDHRHIETITKTIGDIRRDFSLPTLSVVIGTKCKPACAHRVVFFEKIIAEESEHHYVVSPALVQKLQVSDKFRMLSDIVPENNKSEIGLILSDYAILYDGRGVTY